jgi:hypothetical protein
MHERERGSCIYQCVLIYSAVVCCGQAEAVKHVKLAVPPSRLQ